jgi:hypothetical protein
MAAEHKHHFAIEYRDHTVDRLDDTLFIRFPNDTYFNYDVQDTQVDITFGLLRVSGSDIWIDSQKIVESGQALCYAVSISQWTLTRPVGSDVITVVGPGGTSRIQWNAGFQMEFPGLPSICMANGEVTFGNRVVIKLGRLYDAESNDLEKLVEVSQEHRPASRNEQVMPLPTYEQI